MISRMPWIYQKSPKYIEQLHKKYKGKNRKMLIKNRRTDGLTYVYADTCMCSNADRKNMTLTDQQTARLSDRKTFRRTDRQMDIPITDRHTENKHTQRSIADSLNPQTHQTHRQTKNNKQTNRHNAKLHRKPSPANQSNILYTR